MRALSKMIGLTITPEPKDCQKPRVVTLTAPIQAKSKKPEVQYESDVFNFFLANKEELGIRAVMKFSALVVDGALELFDGRRLTVEVKFRMNWERACQAEWQFRTFMKEPDSRPFPVDGGIVVFEDFSGDWNRKAACRHLENGWSHWYRGHAEVDGRRLDLLRLRADKLEDFPSEVIIVENFKSLPEAEANKVLTGLGLHGSVMDPD
jgi:hypothetical protein